MSVVDMPGFVAPLAAAVLAGAVLGLEREWRGRSAGFRTHILVCLASALLMEAAASQHAWRFVPLAGAETVSDPTRMAHGILTGIGFLCAGVVFRSGFTIHGLTTAASLWITAALGILFGVGLYAQGVAGTLVSVAVLTALRVISHRLPGRSICDVEVSWRRETDSRAAIEAAMAGFKGARDVGGLELIAEADTLRRRYRIETRGEVAVVDLGDALTAIPGVTGWRIDPRED